MVKVKIYYLNWDKTVRESGENSITYKSTDNMPEESKFFLELHIKSSLIQDNSIIKQDWYRYMGEIELEENTSETLGPLEKTFELLDKTFDILNEEDNPFAARKEVSYRSMSVGDIIEINGQYYLCALLGFTPVHFE